MDTKKTEQTLADKPRSILIAGYSAGLGSALERRFAQAGYEIITVARQHGATIHCDLTDAEASAELFARLDQTSAPLAGVIHNAMEFLRLPLLETSTQQMESVWRSMVLTAFNLTQQAVPRLIQQGGGSMLFSGASGSLRAGAGFAAFSSAKFALRGLVQALAREHGQDGIHAAHIVIDGLIRTEKTAIRFADARPASMIDPDALADQYFQLFHQAPSVWSQEIDIRPQDTRQQQGVRS
ncbi:SDR family NAD(P)-dependent oxidoreductase [Undibacterium curvum]|uniref:SDR family NAD(P)-dependent oxidoreductase n=1 Tax=Undibacterium curvum TaxID=2762294 RepID=A0ABR7A034_9BURK|nr:SDR family NAD(P)-dependent oxidoreductase [Undibacterium curvum]MBC3930274.1 SDR family NAD(P)-dependent oxidoreductase [Undibacterium curvum]